MVRRWVAWVVVLAALALMVALRLTDRKQRVGRSVPSVAVDPAAGDGRGGR
jgi:hypothetical protein